MARYIDADILRKNEIARCHCVPCVGSNDNNYKDLDEVLSDCPTADVVPKSEVERLQEEANRYKRYYFRHDYDEMIAEVLDTLDRFINANCIEIKDERGIKGYVTSGVHFAIAELKKKYTEDQSDG